MPRKESLPPCGNSNGAGYTCPVGIRADALRVTCEGTRGLPPATGGTLTIDVFTLLLTIFGFLMMAIAFGGLVWVLVSASVPYDNVRHTNAVEQESR